MVTEVKICFTLSKSTEESLCNRLRVDTFREKLLRCTTMLPEIQSFWRPVLLCVAELFLWNGSGFSRRPLCEA